MAPLRERGLSLVILFILGLSNEAGRASFGLCSFVFLQSRIRFLGDSRPEEFLVHTPLLQQWPKKVTENQWGTAPRQREDPEQSGDNALLMGRPDSWEFSRVAWLDLKASA